MLFRIENKGISIFWIKVGRNGDLQIIIASIYSIENLLQIYTGPNFYIFEIFLVGISKEKTKL
jgi:hypothetical protein